jgi:hypothetical protein
MTPDEVLRGYSDSSDHLIVYVFFNNMAAATSPAALQLLFSSRPTPPTCSIHILTPTAIQMRHLQPIVREVYDRISRQIRRIEEYGHTLDEPPVWMRYPSFTLAPDQPPKMQLTLTWPLRSYDLLNKWRLVHGAYAYDKDLEIVIAFVIDSEGESHEVRTWRTKDMGMRERLQRLWDFFRVFADKAAIEWRMSICRLGAMSSDEAEGMCLSSMSMRIVLTKSQSGEISPDHQPQRSRCSWSSTHHLLDLRSLAPGQPYPTSPPRCSTILLPASSTSRSQRI